MPDENAHNVPEGDQNVDRNEAEEALDKTQEAIDRAVDEAGADQRSRGESAAAPDGDAGAPDAGTAAKSDGDEDEALRAAAEAIDETSAIANSASGQSETQAFDLPVFMPDVAERSPEDIAILNDVNLNVKIELGRTRMLVSDVLRLGSGAVVELDKLAGDPVDVFVNERLVARGEVLVLNDIFCVRISEILNPEIKIPNAPQ